MTRPLTPAEMLTTLTHILANTPDRPIDLHADTDEQAEARAEDRKWMRAHGRGDDARAERDYERWIGGDQR